MQIGGRIGDRIPSNYGTGVIVITDTAVGSSSLWYKANITVTESATGLESVTGGMVKHIYDEAVGSSVIAISSILAVSDSAVGSSEIAVPFQSFSIQDSAVGSEDLVMAPVVLDSAVGSASYIQEAQLTVVDSAEGIAVASVGGIKLLFQYDGTIAPGETLEIDAEDLIIELEGENVRPDLEGGFPFLFPGTVDLKYNDGETSRTVELTIEKEDKHV